ncbi:MAG: hypothetical protein ACR2PJ_05195 [Pseudomonadales bacterium]
MLFVLGEPAQQPSVNATNPIVTTVWTESLNRGKSAHNGHISTSGVHPGRDRTGSVAAGSVYEFTQFSH